MLLRRDEPDRGSGGRARHWPARPECTPSGRGPFLCQLDLGLETGARQQGRSRHRWFVSIEFRYKKLAEYLRGWVRYFGISEYYRPIPEIDHWLRRRMRMCYWKQWRFCRTKVKNLLSLGTYLKTAIDVAMSRKGPWRLARTLATQTGMTNKWLAKQGLLSVKDLWVSIHYPATAR